MFRNLKPTSLSLLVFAPQRGQPNLNTMREHLSGTSGPTNARLGRWSRPLNGGYQPWPSDRNNYHDIVNI